MLTAIRLSIAIGLLVAVLALNVLFFYGYPGVTPKQTANILVNGPNPGAALLVSGLFGDRLLDSLREDTNNYEKLNGMNGEKIANVLAQNKSVASLAVLTDLYKRQEPLAHIVGTIGLAEHGKLRETEQGEDVILTNVLRVWAIGRVDPQQPTTELIEEDNKVELALLALGKLGSSKAIPYITTVLERRPADYWVHTRACDTLAKLGDRAAIPVLVRSLEDPSFNALSAAFLALLALGERHAVPLAIERIGPEINGLNSGFVIKELTSVTGVDFGFDKTKWESWWKSVEPSWTIPTTFLSNKLGGRSSIWLRASTHNWFRPISDNEELVIEGLFFLLVILVFHYFRRGYFTASVFSAITLTLIWQFVTAVKSGASWEAWPLLLWFGTVGFILLFFPTALILGIPFLFYRRRRSVSK